MYMAGGGGKGRGRSNNHHHDMTSKPTFKTTLSEDEIRELLVGRRFPTSTKTDPATSAEYNFRKGYLDGWLSATEVVFELHRKGYGRPSEIGNVLSAFTNQIRTWKRSVFTEKPLNRHDTPAPTVKAWNVVRQHVFARDGHRCAFCGSDEELEIDHIETVRDGGTPTIENLRVLCGPCNRGRNSKT